MKNKKENKFNQEDFNFMTKLMLKSYTPPSYFNRIKRKKLNKAVEHHCK